VQQQRQQPWQRQLSSGLSFGSAQRGTHALQRQREASPDVRPPRAGSIESLGGGAATAGQPALGTLLPFNGQGYRLGSGASQCVGAVLAAGGDTATEALPCDGSPAARWDSRNSSQGRRAQPPDTMPSPPITPLWKVAAVLTACSGFNSCWCAACNCWWLHSSQSLAWQVAGTSRDALPVPESPTSPAEVAAKRCVFAALVSRGRYTPELWLNCCERSRVLGASFEFR